jgi:dipeptidyl aminopeptidase/acylaminoacyl peptidase
MMERYTVFCARLSRRIMSAALAAAGVTAHLSAQATTKPRVTADDYARAERLLGGNLVGALRNALVIPHWLGSADRFWYKRDTPVGHDYVVVDAATGEKRAAFNHRALAEALSSVVGVVVDANNLPLSDLTFSANVDTVRIVSGGKGYECGLVPAHCIEGRGSWASPPFAITFQTPLPPTHENSDEGLLISPDDRWGVFARNGNLWARDRKNGQERALTYDGEGPNYGYGIYPGGWKAAQIPRARAVAAGHSFTPLESYWSPDSRIVMVPRVDQRNVADYPFVESVPGDGSFRPRLYLVRVPLVGEKTASVEWFAVDVPKGTVTRLELPYDKLLVLQQDLLAIRKSWWGPGNKNLYAVAFGDNMESAYLFDADIETGKVRTVVEERMLPRTDLNSTSYNPPNVRVTKDGKDVIWWSQRDGWGHLYLYDAAAGKLRNQITKGDWLVRDIIDVDETRRRIYFTGGGREGGNPYYRHLYRVNFDGSGLVLLSPENADAMLTGEGNDVLALDGAQGYDVVSPSGSYVVYNYSTPSEPTQTVIRRTDDGRLVSTFEKADASRLYAAGFRAPEEFVAKAADGITNLWGVVYKPGKLDPHKRYPIIDEQYASPLTAVVPRNFLMASSSVPNLTGQAPLAELGFVVVVIDGRGTTYRSREFLHSSYGKLNINGLDDHVAAIKQLGKRLPYADTTRVGIIGASYGGWSAFRGMLEFPDFYKVGIAGSPPGSMQNMYLDYHWTAFQGRPVYSDASELRSTPRSVPKNWNSIDGRQQASRLKGHLLIMMGELDENVLPGSTLQFIDALMKANKDFDLIYLPNQAHSTGYNSYTTRHVWDYFVRHLMNALPPEGYQFRRPDLR